jgi:hypothetical protein
VTLDPSLRVRLTEHSLPHYTGTTLFDELARVVCRAECLPRKELYESWETARRVNRQFKARAGESTRVVDLACGHALTAAILLLLDDKLETALAVDRRLPESAHRLKEALTARWPKLEHKLTLVEGDLKKVELTSSDIVVSVHACGRLTDLVLEQAVAARARVAVLPCCHQFGPDNTQTFLHWADTALAQDMTRAFRLEQQGYRVYARTIPSEITPKNRLLLGAPLTPAPL